MVSDDPDSGDDGRVTRRLRDPYLLVFTAVQRGFYAIGASYEQFEEFSGWIRFTSGVGAFLFSVYFGDAVRAALDRLIGVFLTLILGHFGGLPLRTWLVLLLLAVLSIQSAATNQRVVDIVDTLNSVGSESRETMGAPSEPATDGGRQHTSREATDRTISYNGAFLGAVFGAIFGAMFGSIPMVVGTLTGSMFGHEIEKCALRTSQE